MVPMERLIHLCVVLHGLYGTPNPHVLYLMVPMERLIHLCVVLHGLYGTLYVHVLYLMVPMERLIHLCVVLHGPYGTPYGCRMCGVYLMVPMERRLMFLRSVLFNSLLSPIRLPVQYAFSILESVRVNIHALIWHMTCI